MILLLVAWLQVPSDVIGAPAVGQFHCNLWLKHYDHPHGQRTSNLLDRIMRSMHRYFYAGQHLHGSQAINERHGRGWALLWNFAPGSPATTRANGGWRSPAERLNQHRYHDDWLQNLLIAASLGGRRIRTPQNP